MQDIGSFNIRIRHHLPNRAGAGPTVPLPLRQQPMKVIESLPLSQFGRSRHFAAGLQFGNFRSKADIEPRSHNRIL
jgi:hypothetical protein